MKKLILSILFILLPIYAYAINQGATNFLGNVGIGTQSPTSLLYVNGAATFNGTGQSTLGYGLLINNGGNSTLGGGDLGWYNSADVLAFDLNATTGVVGTYNTITTVNNGMASEVAVSNLTGQSAAISATTLYAVPSTGFYVVSWTAIITTAGTSSTLGGSTGFQLKYTSPDDSTVITESPTSPVVSSTNTTGTGISGMSVAYCKIGTNLQYLFGYTSSGTTMVYSLHITVESL